MPALQNIRLFANRVTDYVCRVPLKCLVPVFILCCVLANMQTFNFLRDQWTKASTTQQHYEAKRDTVAFACSLASIAFASITWILCVHYQASDILTVRATLVVQLITNGLSAFALHYLYGLEKITDVGAFRTTSIASALAWILAEQVYRRMQPQRPLEDAQPDHQQMQPLVHPEQVHQPHLNYQSHPLAAVAIIQPQVIDFTVPPFIIYHRPQLVYVVPRVHQQHPAPNIQPAPPTIQQPQPQPQLQNHVQVDALHQRIAQLEEENAQLRAAGADITDAQVMPMNQGPNGGILQYILDRCSIM